jgi:hypothetical protein
MLVSCLCYAHITQAVMPFLCSVLCSRAGSMSVPLSHIKRCMTAVLCCLQSFPIGTVYTFNTRMTRLLVYRQQKRTLPVLHLLLREHNSTPLRAVPYYNQNPQLLNAKTW